MERVVVRSKNKLLKLLPPRAALAITFPTHPFSPKKDKRSDHLPIKPKSHLLNKGGFSGPILPEEVRRTINSSSFRAHEPASPKVSCMGQIKKHKKRKTKIIKHESLPTNFQSGNSHFEAENKSSGIGKMLEGLRQRGRKSGGEPSKMVDKSAPDLGRIKRLPSRRHSLANFDWMAQIAPVDGDHDRDYFSDEESGGEEKEVIIPFSAPITMGGGGGVALEPKKEINLWKRRTMPQPRPLQVN